MVELLKRNKTKETADEIRESTKLKPVKEPKVNFDRTVSTGSTLLDLAIGGTATKGGGIPGGILVGIFGPSGWGKTTLMSEICISAQAQGGFAFIGDAEERLNEIYAKKMGIKITKENYRRPKTIAEVKEMILETPETGDGIIDVTGIDSVAALLSTQDESTKGDKRGSSRAKEFHDLCRKAKSEISKKNRIVVFTNQIQDVQNPMPFGPKEKEGGGNALVFYPSLKMRIGPPEKDRYLKKTVSYKGNKITETIGIRSRVFVSKSTIDVPFRSAEILIIFNYGIDDIQANLEYIKEILGLSSYRLPNGDTYKSMDDAIAAVEQGKMELKLRREVIYIWEEIQNKFASDRKTKRRF